MRQNSCTESHILWGWKDKPRSLCSRADEGVRPYTRPEIEDWIAYYLAGAMEGHIPSAIAFEEFYAALVQEFGRG